MKNKIILGTVLAIATITLLSSCSNIPKNAKPIENSMLNAISEPGMK